MREYVAATVLIMVFIAVFVPLASSNPDGLEKVAQTFGAREQKPIWNGLMTDYSFSLIGNSYVSSLLAGIFGAVIVLLATLLLGKIMASKSSKKLEKTQT